ncbi:GMC family oxidoreductase N-terminal domain-containing protein [Aquisalimonas lutea]|uniref:GMC family oxidoreductase n=1 Tax=Aquisalimonas lutea TaxID=1327750 RepID=UPI0025B45F05|nr:GMC family oxidoreductase N-terminal domain-containing protein [Aquisalimonas lutea]MDN3517522.1 GMC family oxidoreductase N-terminal domain-containing protein [Aquisalimonas lutea]
MSDQHRHSGGITRRRFLGYTAVASGTLMLGGGLWGASINPADAGERRFDYIICGAGSAGCVLADRLSEDGYSVLVIEAGGPDNSEKISTPMRLLELWHTEYDWDYRTAPQQHAHGRRIHWPRGKVLGGSSSLNGMIYIRGNRTDYDGWADLGNTGWDYESVLPYFKKSEDFDKGENAYHGAGGRLHVTSEFEPHPVTAAIVEAAQQAGHPYNEDTNAETQMGVAFTDLNTKNGERHSTAVAFLDPALRRPNLSLITNARVHKTVIENGRATGVTYRQEGELRTVRAEREVILAGGAIESPRILMLSGVGPADHLREHGIDVARDLPGVGQNLHDHTLLPVIFEGAKEFPPPSNMAIQVLHAHAFMKTDETLPGPDMQPLFFHVPTYIEGQEPASPHGFTLNAAGIRPTSRGEILLTGPDPEDPLHIDPNLLATDYDVSTLVTSIRRNREIADQAALSEWKGREVYPGADKRSDEELAEYARSAVIAYHHQCGTCKMGNDDMAVVDEELRVRGVDGLRVVDASIMPFVTSGNTNAPVIMIAEKGADMIKRARG